MQPVYFRVPDNCDVLPHLPNQLTNTIRRKFIYILSVHSPYRHSHIDFFKNILIRCFHLFLNRPSNSRRSTKCALFVPFEDSALNHRLLRHLSCQQCICIGRVYFSFLFFLKFPTKSKYFFCHIFNLCFFHSPAMYFYGSFFQSFYKISQYHYHLLAYPDISHSQNNDFALPESVPLTYIPRHVW